MMRWLQNIRKSLKLRRLQNKKPLGSGEHHYVKTLLAGKGTPIAYDHSHTAKAPDGLDATQQLRSDGGKNTLKLPNTPFLDPVDILWSSACKQARVFRKGLDGTRCCQRSWCLQHKTSWSRQTSLIIYADNPILRLRKAGWHIL